MPAYGTLTNPPALYAGDSVLVFKAEALQVNEYSQQVALAENLASGAKGVRVVIDFNQNPGNVEIDVMEADNDAAGSADYSQVPTGGSLTQLVLQAGPNGASTRLATDLIPFAGQMCCLFVKVAPSNGGTTASARITRAV